MSDAPAAVLSRLTPAQLGLESAPDAPGLARYELFAGTGYRVGLVGNLDWDGLSVISARLDRLGCDEPVYFVPVDVRSRMGRTVSQAWLVCWTVRVVDRRGAYVLVKKPNFLTTLQSRRDRDVRPVAGEDGSYTQAAVPGTAILVRMVSSEDVERALSAAAMPPDDELFRYDATGEAQASRQADSIQEHWRQEILAGMVTLGLSYEALAARTLFPQNEVFQALFRGAPVSVSLASRLAQVLSITLTLPAVT